MFVVLFSVVVFLILIYFIIKMNRRFGAREDDFPYMRNYIPIDDIVERTRRLKNYKFEYVDVDFQMKNVQLLEIEKYYLPEEKILMKKQAGNMEEIADWFNEPCRIRANVIGQDSVYDWWKKNSKYIGKKFGYDQYEMREWTYKKESRAPKHLTNFKPTNLAGVIELYGCKRILDFSAGWGDRLAAAIGKEVDRYVGVDPNPCLYKGYKEIIDKLNVCTNVSMIESPFQTAELGDEMFDLVFTSPPYFALEIYSQKEGQSIEHDSLEEWYNEFLMVSIKKSWEHLIVGGILGVNINDYGTKRYIQRMVADVNKFSDSEYHGTIFYSAKMVDGVMVAPNPQPIFIWKKIEDKPQVPQLLVVDKLEHEHFRMRMYGTELITRLDYEPPFARTDIEGFTVISDNIRRRALFNYMIDNPYDEYVYAGPLHDITHYDLAYVGFRMGKKIRCYTSGRSAVLDNAESYGAIITYLEGMQDAFDARNAAVTNENVFCLGMDLENINDYLVKCMAGMVGASNVLWVNGTSKTFINALKEALPSATLKVVETSVTIGDDKNVYRSTKKYREKAPFVPYYSYMYGDAKIWEIAKKYGNAGDVILNSTVL
jgi:16S rRNA G966 N2-methylase RsmD